MEAFILSGLLMLTHESVWSEHLFTKHQVLIRILIDAHEKLCAGHRICILK